VLIAGGSDDRDWQGTMSSAEIYDPHTGKFQATASMNHSRFELPAEAVQLPFERLLVVGGSKEVELYDPVSRRFLVAKGRMNEKWDFLSETRLNSGETLPPAPDRNLLRRVG
jgi:hypothetical protein